jgi:hypothetical protein
VHPLPFILTVAKSVNLVPSVAFEDELKIQYTQEDCKKIILHKKGLKKPFGPGKSSYTSKQDKAKVHVNGYKISSLVLSNTRVGDKEMIYRNALTANDCKELQKGW